MSRFIFALLALLGTVYSAHAQQVNLYCSTGTGFNTWQPASSTNPCPVTATIGGLNELIAPLTPGTATATNSLVIGSQYNSTQSTFTNGQQGAFQMSARGELLVSPGASGFAVSVTQTTSPWIVAGGGTAGTAATGVLTVQGIASMTPVQVSQATAASLNATVVGTGTFATQSAITATSGAIASGAVASGAFASGAFASGSYASGSQAIGITPTDRTITSASGSSQTLMSALATRKTMTVVNTGNANCGVNPTGGTAAIGGAGTITLAPLGSYTPRVPTLAAVTVICTVGQPIYGDDG